MRKVLSCLSVFSVCLAALPDAPDVFCVSKDWLDMRCSVKRDLPDTDWTLFYSVDGGSMVKCLNVEEGQCTWPSPSASDVQRDDTFQRFVHYTILVNFKNNAIPSNFSFTIDTLAIIKPSKVELRHRTGYRSIILSWKHPTSLLTLHMKYEVIYRSQWNSRQHRVIFNDTVKLNKETSVTLNDLTPYTIYTISVRFKSVESDDRYWSEKETKAVTTDVDVPGTAPKSIVGGYYVRTQLLNTTELFLYLQPVPDRYRHSKEIYYQITLSNQSGWVDGTSNIMKTTRSSPTTVIIEMPDHYDKPNILEVTACNKVKGCSQFHKTVISTPSLSTRGTEYPLAEDIVVESYKEGNYLISWGFYRTVKLSFKSVVYLWCRGDTSGKVCKSDLSWEHRNVSTNHTVVLTSAVSHYQDWIFGVSLIAKNGLSAGLSFTECVFIDHVQTKEPGIPTFDLLVGGDYNKLVVSFTFSFCDSQFFKSKPMWYKIYYKDTSKESTQRRCTEDANVKIFKAWKSLRSVTLHALDPGAQYSVCMVVVTRHGTSQPSDAQYKTLVDSGVSERTSHVVKVTLTVIGCFLCVMIIIAVIRCIRLKWVSMDDNIDDVIIPSNVEDLLSEEEQRKCRFPDYSQSSSTPYTFKQRGKYRFEGEGTGIQLSDENHNNSELQESLCANEHNLQNDIDLYVRTTLPSYNDKQTCFPTFETDLLNISSDDVAGTDKNEPGTENRNGNACTLKDEQLHDDHDLPYVSHIDAHMHFID